MTLKRLRSICSKCLRRKLLHDAGFPEWLCDDLVRSYEQMMSSLPDIYNDAPAQAQPTQAPLAPWALAQPHKAPPGAPPTPRVKGRAAKGRTSRR